MHEIKCPHCGQTFTIDEAGYADIARQVRDNEFDKQLRERLALADQEKNKAVELAETKAAGELRATAAAKEAQIQELKALLDAADVAKELEVTRALAAVQKERDALAADLENARQEKVAAIQLAEAKLTAELHKESATKDAEIQGLRSKLETAEVARKLELTQSLAAVEKERDELKNGLARVELEKQLAETSLKDKYETQLKDRDDAIERLRDMKARLSTKMVGETLEQHCEIEFNKIRSTAFPAPTSRRTTTLAAGARATTSSATPANPEPRSCRSCSR